MATDQSPTQNKLIGTIALLAAFILVSLNFIIRSYYLEMTEAEAHASLVEPDQLNALLAAQNKDLQQSPVPIDVAMKNLATSGRESAPPIIAAQQSDDPSPLLGWAKLPHDAGLAPAPVVAPPASGDGGVMKLPDGGTAPNAMTDAGVSPKPDAGAPHLPIVPPLPGGPLPGAPPPTHPAVDAGP